LSARRGDGAEVPVDVSVRPVRSGEELYFVVSVRDAILADRLQTENAETRALLAEATEESVIGQVLVDAEGLVIQATPALATMLRVSTPEELVGRRGASLISAADLPAAAEALLPIMAGTTDTGECEVRLLTADGAVVWGHIVARSLHESTQRRVISAQVIDITARRQAEERAAAALADLEFRTTHDMLTGLPNRGALTSHLDQLSAHRNHAAAPFAVLYCDIDNFKFVNDEFSHAAGDDLLVAIAERLTARLDDGDLLARVSGDEFVLVLAEVSSAQAAAAAGQGLLDAIREYPFNVGLGNVHSSLSIGISVSRPDADIDTLLREADLALFAAKSQGRARVRIFDSAMRERADLRRRVSESLSEALEQDKIHAWLQPIVRMTDRTVVGFEALARWDSEDDAIPTQDWIDLADEVGLLAPVGERLLAEVIEALARMDPRLWVAVNMAGSQLTPAVVAALLRRLDDAGVDPTRLVVEVMERSLVRSPDSAVVGLQDLADAGVRVFFDDFGTGQSSMTRLGELPIAGLKLHRSFTEALTEQSSAGWRLARALADMADSLGLETIAGGVESELQEHRLIAAGWRFGQGWLFGPAVPPEFELAPPSGSTSPPATGLTDTLRPRLG
jgi:diguanylate cyclase (GGDEF)-like protein/PAS domain S-box-containing protein